MTYGRKQNNNKIRFIILCLFLIIITYIVISASKVESEPSKDILFWENLSTWWSINLSKTWVSSISWTETEWSRTWSTKLSRDKLIKNKDRVIQTTDNSNEKPISKTKITHKWFSSWDIRQIYINEAERIWWENLRILCECENGSWDIDWKGDKWLAYWFAQVQLYRYPQIDKQRFLTDYKYQLEEIRKLRKWWTLFFWPERTNEHTNWIPCYLFVKSRFIIN